MVRPVTKCQAILYSTQEIVRTKYRGTDDIRAPPLKTDHTTLGWIKVSPGKAPVFLNVFTEKKKSHPLVQTTPLGVSPREGAALHMLGRGRASYGSVPSSSNTTQEVPWNLPLDPPVLEASFFPLVWRWSALSLCSLGNWGGRKEHPSSVPHYMDAVWEAWIRGQEHIDHHQKAL